MREFYIEKNFNVSRDRLSFFILKMGGINYRKEYLKGELDMVREYSIGCFLINKNGNGLTLDKLRGRAIIEGFLNKEASINDLLELLKNDLKGNKVYSMFREIPEVDLAAIYEEGYRRQYGNI